MMQKDLPGYNIALVKKRIRELQEKYEKEIKPNEKDYNEQNTKKDFIEPILRVLNWDTETKNEVDAEFCIKNKRSSGSADYALKADGDVKLLLEAKSFDKDLETGYDIINGQKRTYVEQLVGYAFDLNRHMNTKIGYCILTNGKEWRVYNVQWQGVAFDKKLVFLIKIEEFIDKFRKFWSLEKGNITKGDIDRFVVEEDKIPIDRKAVSSLLYCKKLLIDSIIKDYEKNKRDMKYVIDKIINNPLKDAPNGFPKFHEMPEDERLNKFVLEASSNVINKILFIRIIEDKGYLKPKLTKKSVEEWKSWFQQADRILSLFRTACHEADELYNGGIFDVNPYDELNYDNDILDKIIGTLGYFNFEEIDADVIGRIYEIYLGTILSIEEEIRGKKRTKLSADYTERKKLGQYYTPKFVVDFIVKNTLGKLLEGKIPEEVSKIKILDPACGSGSFLIRAFDYLKDYYVRYNDLQMSKVRKNGISNMNNYIENGAIIDYNHKILKDNLHGVDLNDLSTQICSINLWLRALEKDKKLGKLSKNILHGNSLISGVESREELAKYKAELKEIVELREKIKGHYGKELDRKEQDELEKMETKLKELRNKINSALNEGLKEYFDNLDLIHPFNWEVEFTEIFGQDKNKEEQGFDVVIGNPPYVQLSMGKDISSGLKKYLLEKYQSSMGRLNTFGFFIKLGIDLLRNEGFFAYIIPNTVLTMEYYEELRTYILDTCKIAAIVSFESMPFEDAVVENIIIVLEKNSLAEKRNKNVIEIIDCQKNFQIIGKIKQEQFVNSYKKTFNIKFDLKNTNLKEKIEKDATLLKEIAHINQAIALKHDRAKYIHKEKKALDYKPLLDGRDIGRYSINFPGNYLKYDIKTIHSCKRKDIFLIKEKLFFRRVGEGLIVTYDDQQYYALNTLVVITQKNKKFDLKFILGLLNSRLFDYYYQTFLKSTKKVFSEIQARQLGQMPIKENRNIEDKITAKVNIMLSLNKRIVFIGAKFFQALNNQPIPHEKDCEFSHYWESSDLYDFSKETIPFANKTKAKILSMDIKEENSRLIIYTTNISLVQNKKFENIKTIELTIKDDILRRFLYFSLKKYINEKKGRGFGSGIILEVIKKTPVPVYVSNVEKNLDKIKKVMDEFEHETKELWKIDDKTYKTLTEIEEDIEKTDKEIDEMVYELYGITENEKKIIEESLK